MSEWGIALLAAAEVAGQAQANALISTVQATLDEQRRARSIDRRRQVYLEMLDAAQSVRVDRSLQAGSRVLRATSMVELEGPEEVSRLADLLMNAALERNQGGEGGERSEMALGAFIEAARAVLTEMESR
ncbi:hypothetical protein ACWEPZ_08365 [Streptomyces sp. NPDC004288]